MTKLKKKYRIFMSGENAQSLEDTILKRMDQIDELVDSDKENKQKIQTVMDHLDQTYQKVGLVKYDAFNEMGGKLSFSLALLDGDDSGFVLSSMHTQDGCYSYLKEIIHGQSHATLSNEERDALEMALNYNVDAAKLEEKQAQQATLVQQDTNETKN